jgi:hypothetical protein
MGYQETERIHGLLIRSHPREHAIGVAQPLARVPPKVTIQLTEPQPITSVPRLRATCCF